MIGFKGEPGDSAYEIAVKNGFIGTEKDWLAQLGTASAFEQTRTTYTTTIAGQTIFALPEGYTSNSILDVYVGGSKLSNSEYTIDATNHTIILTTGVDEIGTIVEVVITLMTTTELPIVTTISSSSTDSTVPSSKCVYDVKRSIEESEITTEEVDELFA